MKLWKFCQGYVKISIMGKYPEKPLDRLLQNGAALWNVQRSPRGVTADIAMADFKRLRTLIRGCGCRVRIVKKRGLPVKGLELKRSLWFCLLLMLGAAALGFASTRVWFVDIRTVAFPKARAEAVLNELGAVPGAAKRAVRTNDIANALNLLPGVANAKVALKGVVLSVDIAEHSLMPPEHKAEEAQGVYAARDCVISYISVTSGEAKVRAGQAVKKGQLLISGDMSHLKEEYRVPAEGVVRGVTARRFSAFASCVRSAQVRSGRSQRAVAASVCGSEVFVSLPFSSREMELVGERTLAGSAVPIALREYEVYELVPGTVEDTFEEAEKRAMAAAQQKLSLGVPENAKITSVKTRCFKQGRGVTAVITVTTIEPIGVSQVD